MTSPPMWLSVLGLALVAVSCGGVVSASGEVSHVTVDSGTPVIEVQLDEPATSLNDGDAVALHLVDGWGVVTCAGSEERPGSVSVGQRVEFTMDPEAGYGESNPPAVPPLSVAVNCD